MKTNELTQKERLLSYARQRGYSRNALEKALSLSTGAIPHSGDFLSSNMQLKIKQAFPDWDLNWILIGDNNSTNNVSEQKSQHKETLEPKSHVSALYERLLTSKDETIQQLKETQSAKDELIQSLREQIELLKTR